MRVLRAMATVATLAASLSVLACVHRFERERKKAAERALRCMIIDTDEELAHVKASAEQAIDRLIAQQSGKSPPARGGRRA